MYMDQAKWYYIFIKRGTLRKRFHYKILRYLMNQMFGRIVRDGTKVYYYNYYHQMDTVFIFKVFCGKKKLKKLIEEAHLLGLEDELLIFKKEEVK